MADKDLTGQVAIVTGGAQRLGHAMVTALAEAGLRVCIHYNRSAESAHQVCRQLQESGRQAMAVRCDFSDPGADAAGVVDAAYRAWGRVDVLVNSASIFEAASLMDTTVEQFDRHVAVNLRAPWRLAQAFVARLDPQAQGQIVNILDWRALRPVPGHFSYTLTKAALWAMTRLLAQELAPRVRVNAIAPGAILPPADSSPDYLEQLATRIPLARAGCPDDVTEALLYLLRSDFVTGIVLPVTGGQEL
ncbi:MAG: short chain dehydrogenase [Pirellulaceae bacterium]|nr:MAG: short chain dehydrogenase [Pirellulaceae bacterium]